VTNDGPPSNLRQAWMEFLWGNERHSPPKQIFRSAVLRRERERERGRDINGCATMLIADRPVACRISNSITLAWAIRIDNEYWEKESGYIKLILQHINFSKFLNFIYKNYTFPIFILLYFHYRVEFCIFLYFFISYFTYILHSYWLY